MRTTPLPSRPRPNPRRHGRRPNRRPLRQQPSTFSFPDADVPPTYQTREHQSYSLRPPTEGLAFPPAMDTASPPGSRGVAEGPRHRAFLGSRAICGLCRRRLSGPGPRADPAVPLRQSAGIFADAIPMADRKLRRSHLGPDQSGIQEPHPRRRRRRGRPLLRACRDRFSGYRTGHRAGG